MSSWGDFLISEIEGFRVEKGKMAVWSIGGCGFVIKTPEQIVYIDPYFGGSVPPETLRMVPVPFESAMIRRADADCPVVKVYSRLNPRRLEVVKAHVL